MNKKVISYFLVVSIIIASLTGCHQKNQLDSSTSTNVSSNLAIPNSTENISSNSASSMFQYKVEGEPVPFDILKTIENLPAYCTEKEVLAYDKTAYITSRKVGDDEYKFAISEGRSMCEIEGIIVYGFF